MFECGELDFFKEQESVIVKLANKPLSAKERFEINQLIDRCKGQQSTVLRTLSLESLDPCAICMESPKDNETSIPKCGHSFCHDCIMDWIQQSVHCKPTCPLCRANIDVDKLTADMDNNSGPDPLAPMPGDNLSNPAPSAPPLELMDQRLPIQAQLGPFSLVDPNPHQFQAWIIPMTTRHSQPPIQLRRTHSQQENLGKSCFTNIFLPLLRILIVLVILAVFGVIIYHAVARLYDSSR